MNSKKIGTVPLWMGALELAQTDTVVDDLQQQITQYVTDTGYTVTGSFFPARQELLLLHWPETRLDYSEQTLAECQLSLDGLAAALGAKPRTANHLTSDELSCMMGLKVGGYDTGRIATLNEIAQHQGVLTMEPAHMVSARSLKDGGVESYGEPTVYLQGDLAAEGAIHAIGDQLEQHHYGIQRGTGVTDFYETKWASLSSST